MDSTTKYGILHYLHLSNLQEVSWPDRAARLLIVGNAGSGIAQKLIGTYLDAKHESSRSYSASRSTAQELMEACLDAAKGLAQRGKSAVPPPSGMGKRGEMDPGRPPANWASGRLKTGRFMSTASRGDLEQGATHACSCAARYRQSCGDTKNSQSLNYHSPEVYT